MKMTPTELAAILESHRKWLADEPSGARADLAGATLAGANLTDADLALANLTDAILTDATIWPGWKIVKK